MWFLLWVVAVLVVDVVGVVVVLCTVSIIASLCVTVVACVVGAGDAAIGVGTVVVVVVLLSPVLVGGRCRCCWCC